MKSSFSQRIASMVVLPVAGLTLLACGQTTPIYEAVAVATMTSGAGSTSDKTHRFGDERTEIRTAVGACILRDVGGDMGVVSCDLDPDGGFTATLQLSCADVTASDQLQAHGHGVIFSLICRGPKGCFDTNRPDKSVDCPK